MTSHTKNYDSGGQPDPPFGEFLDEAYRELHRIARRLFVSERQNHTLQPTALVHEVFIKLSQSKAVNYWNNRGQFYALATRVMRQILVDYARSKRTEKRLVAQICAPMEDGVNGALSSVEILDLEKGLLALEQKDTRKVKLVELKFFAGLTNQEIADTLFVSVKTVERDWRLARAFLHSRVRKSD